MAQFDLSLGWPAAAVPSFTLYDAAGVAVEQGTVVSSGSSGLAFFAVANLPMPAHVQWLVAEWAGSLTVGAEQYPFRQRERLRVRNTQAPDA